MSRADDLVLVLNAGSSSLKYQVLRMPAGEVLLRAHVELVEAGGWGQALADVTTAVDGAGLSGRLRAIGHRVVHGGTRHTSPAVVDDALIASVEELAELAPLHNPPAVSGMRHAAAAFPDIPQVAVFDTGFFADLPEAAARYAIDVELADAEGIRRYGMHGISHGYLVQRTADLLERPLAELSLITLHLGNGASAAAVQGGRPLDTSMGLTPVEGLVMGSRSGDLDPGVLLHLLRHRGYDADGLDDLLNHRSGLRGLYGSTDVRDVLAAVAAGDPRALLAHEIYCRRIRKYVGAYLALLGGADAIVFAGGAGEHQPKVRADALAGLAGLGIEVDPERNDAVVAEAGVISPDGAGVTVLVVPTDEELAIAREAVALLG
ncbi:acetate kinase [Nocardioides sp. zg-536]|uniref:Acetate kinase n=1 Tax=Nocardioides faecalis TaxID=2803858 RepID=A0A938Y3J7_9ACTN|nr:acetate kinase [Nocardioides faecalis]MBM9459348.1 acetate kinase [Nocardioides faecalis]MBS4751586.1 acetate kinase [Nocardioides faecalis]QVI59536.1 acetate kinase [Nocardioides faecalis]